MPPAPALTVADVWKYVRAGYCPANWRILRSMERKRNSLPITEWNAVSVVAAALSVLQKDHWRRWSSPCAKCSWRKRRNRRYRDEWFDEGVIQSAYPFQSNDRRDYGGSDTGTASGHYLWRIQFRIACTDFNSGDSGIHCADRVHIWIVHEEKGDREWLVGYRNRTFAGIESSAWGASVAGDGRRCVCHFGGQDVVWRPGSELYESGAGGTLFSADFLYFDYDGFSLWCLYGRNASDGLEGGGER